MKTIRMPVPKRSMFGALLAFLALQTCSLQAAVELSVETSTIGHAVFNPNLPSPTNMHPTSVVDFFIDQDQSSGGGGLLPSASVNWDTNTQFALTVSAPPGQRFHVRVPAGRAVGFGGFLWWESTRGGFSPSGSVSVSFGGLEGIPPAFTSSDSVLSDSHGFFGFMDLEGTTVTNDFAFTSMRMVGTVAPQVTGNATENYLPHLESSMQLYYQTTEENDPGRFVFLEPVSPATNNVAPLLTWIRPSNGAVFGPAGGILLTTRATDPDGTINFVDFFAGTNRLGRGSLISTNLYNLAWSNAPLGSHLLHAEAVDNAGGRGVSASVQISVAVTNVPPTNNLLPLVNWLQPTSGAVLPEGLIQISASATDPDGIISFVEFYAGASSLGRGVKSPTNSNYFLTWTNPAAGTYQLRAEARDNAGGVGVSASVEVVITGGNANTLPLLTWIRPSNGAVFGPAGGILITTRAMDPDGTIDFVDFFAGTNRLGRGTLSSTNLYNLTWSNAPLGSHLLHAEAVDNAGGRGVSTSVQISVAATNVPPTSNALPVVTWIRPTNGATFAPRSLILLNARAMDPDGTISFLDFYAGTNRLGRGFGGVTNGYTLSWTNAAAGTYQVRAEAVDNRGGRGISDSVEIIVGGPVVDLGVVEVSTVGHKLLVGVAFTNPPRSAVDFLIDQNQDSGGGAMLSPMAVNWDTNTQFKLTVTAPPGKKFLVQTPPGSAVRFGGFLWWESTRGGFSTPGQVTVTFGELEGTAPQFTQSDSALSDSHGYFGILDVEGTAVTNSFAFASLTFIGTVAPQFTGNGTENYTPHGSSSLQLGYVTTNVDDPGPFVSIVSVNQLPRIEVVTASPDSGTDLLIYGRVGRTHIVECSSDTVNWSAISTNVMPNTAAVALKDITGISVPNRFYRVVELP